MDKAVIQAVVSAAATRAALAAALTEAERLGVKINVAVVDAGGNLAGFLRCPGAFLHSITIAQDKAYTAAGFGLPTSQWPEIFAGMSETARAGIAGRARFTGFGGGLPIVVDGLLVGGIGVSGASEDQDEQCARAGLAAIG
jgi:uncharacterized protein GlcG (DUF336 family)